MMYHDNIYQTILIANSGSIDTFNDPLDVLHRIMKTCLENPFFPSDKNKSNHEDKQLAMPINIFTPSIIMSFSSFVEEVKNVFVYKCGVLISYFIAWMFFLSKMAHNLVNSTHRRGLCAIVKNIQQFPLTQINF